MFLEGVGPVAGIVFLPAYAITAAVSTILAAGVTDGIVVPGVLVAAFSLIGTYVWRFTRRADKVLLDRIRELEIDRNYNRAAKQYFQRWALTGTEPSWPEPKIQDYQPTTKEDDTDGE